MKYIHKMGAHASSPNCPYPWVRRLRGDFWFNQQSRYDLKSPDQSDWNKLCGIGFNPIKPNDNAMLIGWRYNLDSKLFEVGAYFNVNGSIILPKDTAIIKCIAFDRIQFVIDYSSISLKSIEDKVWMKVNRPENLKTKYFTSFRIQPWFGGNRPAPYQVELELTFN